MFAAVLARPMSERVPNPLNVVLARGCMAAVPGVPFFAAATAT